MRPQDSRSGSHNATPIATGDLFEEVEPRRLRLDTRRPGALGPFWTCDEHAAYFEAGRYCPGDALDQRLEQSVAVRAARAFGDWPAVAR